MVVTAAGLLGVDLAAGLLDTDPLVTDTDLLDTEATLPAGPAQGPLPRTEQATPLAAGPVTLVELALPLTVLAETT